jgi:N-acetylmuramoyl-L-alanine amidase
MAIFVGVLTAFLQAGAAETASTASTAAAAGVSERPTAQALRDEAAVPVRLPIDLDEVPSPTPPALPSPAPRIASPASPELATPAQPARDDVRRDGRRRSRNRYPGRIPTAADWEPPEGPVRIALQAGHWRADEAPGELSGLRDNGTSWRGTKEWEANLAIAERAGAMLEDMGYEVDILPAVVPPGYRAHLFIAIHADGSNDPAATGYRVAAPRRDATGRASRIAALLEESYGEATGIRRLPTVTRRMQSYYAFNFRRYEHALHPMTIGVILETGFLTSARDREVILSDPDRAARGIVAAVRAFDVTPPPVVAAGGG